MIFFFLNCECLCHGTWWNRWEPKLKILFFREDSWGARNSWGASLGEPGGCWCFEALSAPFESLGKVPESAFLSLVVPRLSVLIPALLYAFSSGATLLFFFAHCCIPLSLAQCLACSRHSVNRFWKMHCIFNILMIITEKYAKILPCFKLFYESGLYLASRLHFHCHIGAPTTSSFIQLSWI